MLSISSKNHDRNKETNKQKLLEDKHKQVTQQLEVVQSGTEHAGTQLFISKLTFSYDKYSVDMQSLTKNLPMYYNLWSVLFQRNDIAYIDHLNEVF